MTENTSGLKAATPSRSSSEHAAGAQVASAEPAVRSKRDRIAAAYLGRWGSPLTQQRARARIDWMAAVAQGPRILDIGCSEGILALLLARAGQQVVGVDIEPEAIAAARELLNSEPASVRERIELHVADALVLDLGESAFDTVVLGEILEHLADPSAILERVAALLRPGGLLVLTTPFGYFPHPDHRQEFRTTQLMSLLSARFVVKELTVVDGYFRVTAHKRNVPILEERRVRERRVPGPDQLLVATEEAAVAAQRHFHDELQRLRTELIRRKDQLAEMKQLLVETEEAAVAAQKQLHGRIEALRRQSAAAPMSQRALAEKVRRLELQLEQAQLRLKQQEQGLRQELGRAVEKSLRSPLGAFRLPFRVAKAYRRAREREANGRAGGPAAVLQRQNRGAPERIIPHRDLSSAFPPYPFPEREPQSTTRVATILDEFSEACFRYEADLVRLTKEDWRAEIERARPDFLFVESAWRGNRDNWRGLIGRADDTLDNPLKALVNYCKARSIPTIFWNKEDPPNFEHFINAAAKFDHIFTTDANCIDRYRARLGHDRVAALPFAAQPAIHNPVGKVECDDFEVAFAGTWYGQKHEERGALLRDLLDAATDRKLHIFDRMSDHAHNDFYTFPEKYGPFLRVALPYPNLLSAYRKFKVFLNVNSVVDSPTMFARRVFEILASETAVVSSASTGIEQMLGDAVSIVHDEEDARAELDKLLSDAGYRQQKAHAGYRKVMQRHTCGERFRTVVRALGLDLHTSQSPTVSIIIPLDDERWLVNALGSVRRQRYGAIEPLWMVKEGRAAALAERIIGACPGGRMLEVGPDPTLASMLERGVDAAEGALITAFNPRDIYGPEFIGDLVLALTYADAEIVGKAAHFSAASFGAVPVLNERAGRYRYVDQLIGTAWLARRELLRRSRIDRMLSIKDGCLMLSCANGVGRMYSADPYNYVRIQGGEITPSVLADNVDDLGSMDVGTAEIMI